MWFKHIEALVKYPCHINCNFNATLQQQKSKQPHTAVVQHFISIFLLQFGTTFTPWNTHEHNLKGTHPMPPPPKK